MSAGTPSCWTHSLQREVRERAAGIRWRHRSAPAAGGGLNLALQYLMSRGGHPELLPAALWLSGTRPAPAPARLRQVIFLMGLPGSVPAAHIRPNELQASGMAHFLPTGAGGPTQPEPTS